MLPASLPATPKGIIMKKGGTKEINMAKEIGKCAYCADPIYDFQEMVTSKGKQYHISCWSIKKKEEIPKIYPASKLPI